MDVYAILNGTIKLHYDYVTVGGGKIRIRLSGEVLKRRDVCVGEVPIVLYGGDGQVIGTDVQNVPEGYLTKGINVCLDFDLFGPLHSRG